MVIHALRLVYLVLLNALIIVRGFCFSEMKVKVRASSDEVSMRFVVMICFIWG